MKDFELTNKQKQAFNRLKKAHKACLECGIIFYNHYGTLGALDGNKFNDGSWGAYNDNPVGGIENIGQNSQNEFKLECGEWADDTHYFHKI